MRPMEPTPFAHLRIDEVAARRQRRLLIGMLVVLLAGGAATGSLLGLTHGRRNGSAHHFSAAGVVITVGILAIFLLGVVGFSVWLYRRPSYRLVMQYGWRRRTRVVKALRKGQPIADEDLPVAAAVIALQRRQRWVPWLMASVGVYWVCDGLLGHHGPARWLWIGMGAVYLLVVCPVFMAQQRQIRIGARRLQLSFEASGGRTDGPEDAHL